MPDRVRARYPLALLVAASTLAACGDGGGEPATGADESAAADRAAAVEAFCTPALARVDSFMAAARASAPEPSGPRFGGTATVGAGGSLGNGMMSLAQTDYAGNQHHMFVNLMSLVRYDEDYQPQPYLAESWEVAPDHSSITFHLRDDVVWHDGERTDAHDVVFTYTRASDPETRYPNAAFWDFYGEAEAVDSFTVRIAMEPHSEFMDVWRTFTILPEHLLGDVPPAELGNHPFGQVCPVGNGPFVFVSHVPQESWTFEANPAFPEGLGGRPMIDRYVYRIIPEQSTLLAEVLTGGIDMYHQVRFDQAARVQASDQARLVRSDSRSFVFLSWNARHPQLADAAVRRALTRAIDREGIVESLTAGYADLGHTSVPPFHWAFDASTGPDLSYDPAAARAALDEAGWTDGDGDGVRENAEGERLTLEVITNSGNQMRLDIGQVVQAQLAEVGVEMDFQTFEMQALGPMITDPAREFDGVLLTWSHEFRVDDSDLFHGDRLDAPYQFTGLDDDRLDGLLDSLRVATDRAVAGPLWRSYQERLAELQPMTFFYYPAQLNAVSNRLQGVQVDARGEWATIRDWWLDGAGGGDR